MSPKHSLIKGSKTKKVTAIVVAVMLVLITVAFFARGSIRTVWDQLSGAEYSGSSSQTIDFVVRPGDTGTVVAKNLVAKGVTKNLDSTLRHIYAADPTFYPGTYRIPLQISSDQAIALLADLNNLIVDHVTIPEGLRITSVFKILSEKTGLPVADFESASKKTSDYGLPKAAPSLEGYLYPATYDFAPDLTAKQIISLMVNRTKEQLITDGVAKKDWHKTLTLASIIQVEAKQTPDFYKVSRVFLNRIQTGMHLQSDATVSYGVNGSTVSTSNADRNNPNGYNTYLYPGLPIGPISAPGATAIDAALHPAEGDWLYFCAINLKTGETVFSNTYAEHEKAVQLWRQWMLQNPGWND